MEEDKVVSRDKIQEHLGLALVERDQVYILKVGHYILLVIDYMGDRAILPTRFAIIVSNLDTEKGIAHIQRPRSQEALVQIQIHGKCIECGMLGHQAKDFPQR